MAKQPSDLIERCRRIPIEPILKELGAASVPHSKPGGKAEWLRMLCPFHEEKTPSASVSHVHQRFRCHGCGIHGDAVALLMEFEKLSFAAAVQRAEEITGVQPVVKRRKRSGLGTIL